MQDNKKITVIGSSSTYAENCLLNRKTALLVIGIECNLFPGRWVVAGNSGKAGAAPCIQKHGALARRSERKKSLLNIGRNECATLAGWPKSTPRPATHRQQRKLTSINDDFEGLAGYGD